MATVIKLPRPEPIHVPSFLCQHRAWLLWKYVVDEPGKKPRKVPYYLNGHARSGKQGGDADVASLSAFEEVHAAYLKGGWAGVGFAVLPQWGLTGLDFDDCVHDGAVDPQVEALVAGTYAEVSPSGTGIRAFMQGALPNNKSKADGSNFGFETFGSAGFLTITGRVLPICELVGSGDSAAPLTEEVRELCRQRFGKASEKPLVEVAQLEPPVGLSEARIRSVLEYLDPDCSYEEWLKTGMSLHHEYQGAYEGAMLWDAWSRGWSDTEAPGYYAGLELIEAKWDTFGRGERNAITLRSLLKVARERGWEGSTAADFDDLEDVEPDTPPSANSLAADPAAQRFTPLSLTDFLNRPAPQWIIKGVLPRADLIVLYGESGAGKSFVALDLAAAVARGLPWRGKRTATGRVVYVAAEGAGGFRNRVAAYAQHNRVVPAELGNLEVIPDTPNLLDKADVIQVAKAIRLGGRADLVIVDTFAQTTPGANENAAEDMGKALAHCKMLRRKTGAVVLLVHHAGKDVTRGARGWSGLRAAADAEIEVSRVGDFRAMRISKQKDGDDSEEWAFKLEQVAVGVDEDGDAITSCVVDYDVPMVRPENRRLLGKWEKLVVQAVGVMAESQTAGIEVSAVLEEAMRIAPTPETGGRDVRRQRLSRALNSLCEGDEAIYWLEDGCISLL